MQQKEQEPGKQPADNPTPQSPNQMATNPNPRANENLEGSAIEKNTAEDDTSDVGSEITDGEAS